jgi:hypothetical protein
MSGTDFGQIRRLRHLAPGDGPLNRDKGAATDPCLLVRIYRETTVVIFTLAEIMTPQARGLRGGLVAVQRELLDRLLAGTASRLRNGHQYAIRYAAGAPFNLNNAAGQLQVSLTIHWWWGLPQDGGNGAPEFRADSRSLGN